MAGMSRTADIGFAEVYNAAPQAGAGRSRRLNRSNRTGLLSEGTREARSMVTAEIALPDVEELHRLVHDGLEKGS